MTTPARRARMSGPACPMGGNPLAEFDELINQTDGLLETRDGGAVPVSETAWTPLADLTETDNAYRVEVELSGAKSKDVEADAVGQ
ncbi:hypothetical protein [Streptomyces sp. NPDC048248]|uniref:hypothetical protein n=1 Tax=Streptomyces sp. NPDC048248 TaxID=3365523 RepID=UPI00371AF828